MNHGYATESRVRRMKKQLIASGQISESSFDIQHKKNEIATKNALYSKLDKQILELSKKGVTPPEIATCLNLSSSFVRVRQRKIFKEKKISKEKLVELKEKRDKTFEDTRIKAKQEMEDDRSSILNRNKFFELAKAEISYGNNLQKVDIQLLGRCIILNDIFLTRDNLKLVIMQYIKLGNYKEVTDFINILIRFYGDTAYGDALRGFNKLAKEKLIFSKIREADMSKSTTDIEK